MDPGGVQAPSLIGHVRSLSFPRFCGGKGEERAGEYIIEACRALGLAPEIQDFQVHRFPEVFFFRMILLFWGALIYGAYHFNRQSPLLAFFLLFAVALMVLVMSRWSLFYERLFDMRAGGLISSRNIIAKLPAGHDDTGGSAPTLVLMAHYDSKSQSLPIYLRALLMIGGTLGMTALVVITLARLLAPAGLGRILEIAGTAGIIAVLASLLLIMVNRSIDASPGAMDNASGVAVLLGLLRRVSGEKALAANIHVIFTGAEEIGLCGAVRYLQAAEASYDRKSTFVVNLDGVGGREKLLVVDRYGFPPLVTGAFLGQKIRQMARERGLPLHGIPLILGALWDHVVWARRGFESVTLSLGGWEKATFMIHGEGDAPENIVGETLEAACDICILIAGSIGAWSEERGDRGGLCA
jgi:hypothetical protein